MSLYSNENLLPIKLPYFDNLKTYKTYIPTTWGVNPLYQKTFLV